MRKVAFALFVVVAVTGCAFKEMQRPDLIGDSETKTYFKNVPTNEGKIPEGRRVYFKNMDEAMGQGYKSAQEAGGGGAADATTPD